MNQTEVFEHAIVHIESGVIGRSVGLRAFKVCLSHHSAIPRRLPPGLSIDLARMLERVLLISPSRAMINLITTPRGLLRL